MVFSTGGSNRARTCDPLLVRQVLSQLSYAPKMVTPRRLELLLPPWKGGVLDRLTKGPQITDMLYNTQSPAHCQVFFPIFLWKNPMPRLFSVSCPPGSKKRPGLAAAANQNDYACLPFPNSQSRVMGGYCAFEAHHCISEEFSSADPSGCPAGNVRLYEPKREWRWLQ